MEAGSLIMDTESAGQVTKQGGVALDAVLAPHGMARSESREIVHLEIECVDTETAVSSQMFDV